MFSTNLFFRKQEEEEFYKECSICCDNNVTFLLSCSNSCSYEICISCLQNYINNVEIHSLKEILNENKIKCIHCNGNYSKCMLAKNLSEDDFNTIEKLVSIKERNLIEKEIFENIKKQEKNQSKFLHQVSDVLTLKCPSCYQAFVDFDACTCLKCSRCNSFFCGWCLRESFSSMQECQKHVVNCNPYKKDTFCKLNIWENYHQKKNIEKLIPIIFSSNNESFWEEIKLLLKNNNLQINTSKRQVELINETKELLNEIEEYKSSSSTETRTILPSILVFDNLNSTNYHAKFQDIMMMVAENYNDKLFLNNLNLYLSQVNGGPIRFRKRKNNNIQIKIIKKKKLML